MKPGDFVTADTHFGHANIRLPTHADRPFDSVEEMDEALIRRWNTKVHKTATIYHLGDFAWRNKTRALEIRKRLQGRIILIRGNHEQAVGLDFHNSVRMIANYLETKTPDGTLVCMFHYPLLTWNKARYGAWMLHGHCHGRLPDTNIRRLDVGVDAHPNYEPFSYHEIVALMQDRVHQAVDHHT